MPSVQNHATAEGRGLNIIKLREQVGEHVILLHWHSASEALAEQLQIALGQEANCHDPISIHVRLLLEEGQR